MQEDHLVLVFGGGEMHVGGGGQARGQAGQLEVVGGEQREGAARFGQVLGGGGGQRQAVVGAGATPDFIEQDQASVGGAVQDVGRLGHLHHERGASAAEIVGSTDAGEDAVHRPDGGRSRRHVAAGAGEQHDERGLTHVGRFAAHVGAGDDEHALLVVQLKVVGHKGFAQRLAHHRVPTAADGKAGLVAEAGGRKAQALGPFG